MSFELRDVSLSGCRSGEKFTHLIRQFHVLPFFPGSFFTPKSSQDSEDSSSSRLRISIANVSKERLNVLPSRLALFTKIWEVKGEGWGVD